MDDAFNNSCEEWGAVVYEDIKADASIHSTAVMFVGFIRQ